jgi:Sigma-70, region 4
MVQEISTLRESLIPPQPIPAGARAFSSRIQGLLDGQPKDDATVAKALEGMDDMFDLIAAGLYNMASMLVGAGEDSVRLVETAVTNAEVATGHDPEVGRKNSRRALSNAALEIIEQRNPGSLAAPAVLEPAGTCIEDDDLDAAGVSGAEIERMIAGPDRNRVRNWLESLPTAVRTIFVLRAVAGFTADETAELLTAHGGPKAAGWTEAAVRAVFRQGLCSLASQLIHATIAR